MSAITSRPYNPAPACERCVFGRGEHAEFCDGPLECWCGHSKSTHRPMDFTPKSFPQDKWDREDACPICGPRVCDEFQPGMDTLDYTNYERASVERVVSAIIEKRPR